MVAITIDSNQKQISCARNSLFIKDLENIHGPLLQKKYLFVMTLRLVNSGRGESLRY
jgi:hypothetical protein